MKKCYLSGLLLTIFALGLVFTGCDLFNAPGGGSTQQNYENLVIRGTAGGIEVRTEFSTTRPVTTSIVSRLVMTPKTGDSYKIFYNNIQASSGTIDITGTTLVTFKPSSGTSFDAILTKTNDESGLIFPEGIHTTTNGTITNYVNKGSSPVNPQFDADLDTTPVTLSSGQTKSLSVTVKSNSAGGNVFFQWYRAAQANSTGTAISGATLNTYTLPASTPGIFYYYVVVGNASGGVLKSASVRVTVTGTGGNMEIIVGKNGGIPINDLKSTINTLLGSAKSTAYTVIFADDLDTPLFVCPENFPGTGKLTIKANVKLTKGIHITRSNVELNGLTMEITDINDVPMFWEDTPSAILISDRYSYYYTYPGTAMKHPAAESFDQYNKYSTINKVAVVNCNINFTASSLGKKKPMLGIAVDPYTVGRTVADRVKITGNTVYVDNTNSSLDSTDGANSTYRTSSAGRCFNGNHADLSGNTFTSTKDAVYIVFLFAIEYAKGGIDTISFKDNRFITTNGYQNYNNLVAQIEVNGVPSSTTDWPDEKGKAKIEKIQEAQGTIDDSKKFGKEGHTFADLPAPYQTLIKDLFTQIPDNLDKKIRLADNRGDDNSDDTWYSVNYTRTDKGIDAERADVWPKS